MGIVADAVIAAGGHAIGVIPHALVAREIAHRGLPDLRVVNSMHERKAMMADLSDAFIALPGGFGTFEEFCEVVTWTQLGLHRKRCGLVNVAGFYDPLLALFDRATAEGFIRSDNRDIVVAEADPAVLLDRLSTPPAAHGEKWLRSAEQTEAEDRSPKVGGPMRRNMVDSGLNFRSRQVRHLLFQATEERYIHGNQ